MSRETWKDIPNFEGVYQVSDLGNVRSLKFHKVKILKPVLGAKYLVVNLFSEGKKETRYIHKLVAIVFLGHNPNGHNVIIDHKDNNPLNNRLDNLQEITHRRNLSKDKKNKTSKYTGVSWDKKNKKWQSKIRIDGKQHHLGCFDNEYDAHIAYKEKLDKNDTDLH